LTTSEESDVSDITTVATTSYTTDDNDELDLRLAYTTISDSVIVRCRPVEMYRDGNGLMHTLAKFPVVQTGKKKKRRSRVQSYVVCGNVNHHSVIHLPIYIGMEGTAFVITYQPAGDVKSRLRYKH